MAAPVINLGNYRPISSAGNFTLPTASTPKNQYVASLTASNPLSTLNLANPGGLKPTTGISNQSLLPSYLQNGGQGNSNGATAPVATSITPPTSTSSGGGSGSYYGVPITPGNDASVAQQIAAIDATRNGSSASSLNSPSAQSYVSSVTDSSPQGYTAPPTTTGQPNGSTGTAPGATPPTGTGAPTAAPSPYDTALKNYITALSGSQNIDAQVQKQTLDANHTYQNDLDASGGLLGGNQKTAALDARRSNASLADLGVASTSATNAANLAFQELQYQQKTLPNSDPYTLSPGDTRYDAQGNIISQAPAATGKTIGTPATGVYQQNADGSFTQVMAPVGGDNVQSLAQELVTGNLAPADLSKRSTGIGSYNDILNAANQISQQLYGKPFDIAKASTDYTYANNKTTQDTLNYLGSLTGGANDPSGGNLGQLISLSAQVAQPKGLLGLGQSNFPALNDATQWAKLSSGDPQIAAYYATLLEVSDQIAKVLQGGGGSGTSDAKLAQAQSLFQKGFTKDQISSVASSLKDLLGNRAKSIIGDNPYLSTYAQQFGITQNNNKGTGSGTTDTGGDGIFAF